ncbi:P-loop NTPase [Candidatus Bathyarchaeota archaeon]|nr:P-loop NTPase [Candidatus Bathyarchaeota archaeon]
MIDPRKSIINKRLGRVKHIIAVSSGKGGVGKSLVASTLALILANKKFKVGLFDADFTSPSTHLILGVKNAKPREEKGVIPAHVHGLKYVSIVAYSRENALPLRGADVSNALMELFATIIWGELDFLIVDMPPGISDALLDVIRLVKGINFLIVTTPSPLAFETVKKLLELLAELKVPVVGVVENMKIRESNFIPQNVRDAGFRFLGELPFDPKVEDSLGNVDTLLKTDFAIKLAKIALEIFL